MTNPSVPQPDLSTPTENSVYTIEVYMEEENTVYIFQGPRLADVETLVDQWENNGEQTYTSTRPGTAEDRAKLNVNPLDLPPNEAIFDTSELDS